MKCEKKLQSVIVPEKWSSSSEQKKKLVGNKSSVSKKSARYTAMKNYCRLCKKTLNLASSKYCQKCAYKKGICSMCGIKVLETKNYKMSSV